jgi:hypothetical protein
MRDADRHDVLDDSALEPGLGAHAASGFGGDDQPTLTWPASALDAAELGFQQLTRRRTPVAFDARGLGHGLPDRHVPLEELRDLLVRDPRISYDAKDAAWHQVVEHARVVGQPWITAAVGLALPALVAMAGRLRPGREQVIADVESELVTGFLGALRHDDLSGPRPQLRMCWAGWRTAVLVRDPSAWEEVPDMFDPSSRLPARPYGHPDLLLGRAARLGIIRTDDAELISETRFGRVLIEEVADRRGVDPAALRMRRRRAELAVAQALTQLNDVPVSDVRPDPRPGRAAGRGVRRVHSRSTRSSSVASAPRGRI